MTRSTRLLSLISVLALTGCPDPEPPVDPIARCIDIATNPRCVDPGPGIDEVRTLSQNWSHDESNWFYAAPQGSRFMPYDWFLNLEQANSTTLFRDNDNIRRFGYVTRKRGPQNPDGLPIGMAKDAPYPDDLDGIGFTCAACHTGRVEVAVSDKRVMFLVDGAPTLADMSTFQRELAAAMRQTFEDDAKFERFAAALGADSTTDKSEELKSRLESITKQREMYNRRNLPATDAPSFGHARVDAFGAIMNQVVGNFLDDEANVRPANAPVSYPFIWDAPHHDRVQWNGIAENNRLEGPARILQSFVGTDEIGALGRNTGEVLGVFGFVNPLNEKGLLGGYESTDNRSGLIALEDTLKTLWSPKWPEELGSIDFAKAELGETVFRNNCNGCHATIGFERDSPERRITAIMQDVGTDQTMAENYATRKANTRVLEGRREKLRSFLRGEELQDEEPVSKLLSHMVIRSVVGPDTEGVLDVAEQPANYYLSYQPLVQIEANGTILVGPQDRWQEFGLADFEVQDRDFEQFRQFNFNQELIVPDSLDPEQIQELDRDLGPDAFVRGQLSSEPIAPDASVFAQSLRLQLATARQSYPYKARPLNGIWATAPYLHNGSVPNLWELLKSPTSSDPEKRRTAKFYVGSSEFDAVNVGFVSDNGPSEFDTTLPGNSNAGHPYGSSLSDEQKWQLIEYLKTQ